MNATLYVLNAAALVAVLAFQFHSGSEKNGVVTAALGSSSYASQHNQHQAPQRAVMTRNTADSFLTSSEAPVPTTHTDHWTF